MKRFISFSGGVESTAMCLLYGKGATAIFCDTGSEHKKMYERLNYVENMIKTFHCGDFELVRIKPSKVYKGVKYDSLTEYIKAAKYFPSGQRRFCTADFKIKPIDDFLKQFETGSIDFVLYDPPYSPRQVSECYKKLGKTVNIGTTQASFWGNIKKEIARVTKANGIVISFGWNTNGIGKTKGFEILEILTVAHGGQHNDTLCTVERKVSGLFD